MIYEVVLDGSGGKSVVISFGRHVYSGQFHIAADVYVDGENFADMMIEA